MNVLTLLRGCPAVGKSTFIKKHNLENHTISIDAIRLLLGSPTWDVLNDKETPSLMTPFRQPLTANKIALQAAESRMKTGDIIFIDAQNIDTKAIKDFKNLARKYGYRINVIDFKDEFTLEEVLQNNKKRPDYKIVEDSYLIPQYEYMHSKSTPSYANVYTPAEFEKTMRWLSSDLNKYNRIKVFGDIHGCYTALKEVIKSETLDDDTFYIFLGDFFDRGIENAEVFDFLFKNKDAENVLLLRGNHEKHLLNFVRGEKVTNSGTKQLTIPEILRSGYTAKDIEAFTRKIQPFFAFHFNEQEYICSHGGVLEQQLNTVSKGVYGLMTVSIENIVNGLGGYEFDIDYNFSKEQQEKENPIIQFHGHRNTKHYVADKFPNIYNLEGAVEQGGELRVAEITREGIEVITVKNEVISPAYVENSLAVDLNNLDGKIVLNILRESHLVTEKRYSKDISAFNFSNKAFRNKQWNQFTITARGLFLDREGKVMFRGYPKFFNLEENDYTTLEAVEESMQFPVRKLQKENGFLGILGYNPYTDSLDTVTKGGKTSYSKMFKKLLFKHFKDIFGPRIMLEMERLKELLKEKNATLTFEVIDIANDPHIVRYDDSKLVLLHAIKNDFSNTYYTEFCKEIANQFYFDQPKFEVIHNMEDLKEDIEQSKVLTNQEGFVYEGSNHYMFKLKTDEYNHYKYLRGVLESYASRPTSFNEESFKEDNAEIVKELEFLYQSEDFDILNLPSMIFVIQLLQANNITWEKVPFDFGRKKAWLAAEL